MRPIVLLGGSATLAAYLALAISQASLGSPLFFGIVAVPCVVYALLLRRTFSARAGDTSRAYGIALLFALAFRIPLAVAPVSARSDMIRYLYDGRVQRLGYNPYLVVPSDPSLAATHTDLTRDMPSRNARTPYGAAAQLFFRLIVTIDESPRLMKAALTACDLLTIGVLAAWLRSSARSPWLVLGYAWHPLVVLEIAHSGHIDALGALLTAVAAWMLSTGRPARATAAFVLAVATKPLPIVLLPLFWKRIGWRAAAAGAAALIVIYLPFRSAGAVPLGALPNVVEAIRFNGPAFKGLRLLFSPQAAAAAAIGAGLLVAAWMRVRRAADDPAAWGWPMAVTLAAAPVVYPWYLLYLTPFFLVPAVVPVIVWAISVIPVYIVWELAYRHGHRWAVPVPLMALEYGVAIASGLWLRAHGVRKTPEP